MEQATAKIVRLPTNITQRNLRVKAFARRFAETMDSAEAYRDVYRPATNPQPGDKARGDRLLRLPEVQKLVGDMIKPTLVAMGVDQSFALRRLIETVDSDITDYHNPLAEKGKSSFMSLAEMREQLPLEKRRLIKKYKETYDQMGFIKSIDVELEPKQPALELLAKMRGWVQPDNNVIVDGDAMLALMDAARAAAADRADQLRASFATSRTASQINRPAGVQPPIEGEVKVLPKPDAAAKPEGKDGP